MVHTLIGLYQEELKIPKAYLDSVNQRRTENTMTKIKTDKKLSTKHNTENLRWSNIQSTKNWGELRKGK